MSGALAQAVGPSRAAALMLIGDRFDVEEARRWGLVHQVVPDGSAAEEGLALAQRLATGPTVAYAELKALLRGAGGDTDAVLEREAAAQEASPRPRGSSHELKTEGERKQQLPAPASRPVTPAHPAPVRTREITSVGCGPDPVGYRPVP
ncbi:enoyl-CoA hydratase/isomerase family protein [Streptomyces sp. NPDC056672]|uniref:enoyl-CoA hydratase/isomerase family protein n=1 Tax=Streptomyces sp. NPDC056672 TaxID=3345906 RepID=UPI0036ADF865